MRYLYYLILTLSLLFFSACISSKSPKKDENALYTHLGHLTPDQKVVKKELDIYLSELKSFNTDAIVELTYPKLFNVIDLELFRQYIASMMNSTDILVESYETNITKISKVIHFSNGTQFAKIDYTSKAKILFLNENLYNTETSINYLYDALIHKYGKENIEIDVKKRTLKITRYEHLLIIKEKDKDWKFIGDNREYRRLYPLILPNEIVEFLKNEKE